MSTFGNSLWEVIVVLEEYGNERKHEQQVQDEKVVKAIVIIHEFGADTGNVFVRFLFVLHGRLIRLDIPNYHL